MADGCDGRGPALSDGSQLSVVTGIDDHSRFCVIARLVERATARPVCDALMDGLARYGVPEQILTDNAKCHESKPFTAFCAERGIRQSFTRPYTPQTNGKAERFIQTLKRRWAYRYVFRTSAIRADSLRPWVTHYNHQRPHRALGKQAPMARLREARQQRA